MQLFIAIKETAQGGDSLLVWLKVTAFIMRARTASATTGRFALFVISHHSIDDDSDCQGNDCQNDNVCWTHFLTS